MSNIKKQFFLFLFMIPSLLLAQNEAYLQGKLSPYTANFISSLENTKDDTTKSEKIYKRFKVNHVEDEKYINAFIELNTINDNILNKLKSDFGVKINSVIGNYITTQIPVNNIEIVSLIPEINHVEIGIPVYKKMDQARPVTFVDDVQNGTGLKSPYTGKDVIIGFIDGGFEYGHPAFYNTDRSELRIKRAWNQNATSGTKPTGYNYGAEYTTSTAILNTGTDDRFETHGTHVAGIAAGADKANSNIYYGIATEADLVMVSYNYEDGSYDNVSVLDGVKYIYNYADNVGKPCVINMSLGTHYGPHDGTSTFDRLCDQLQGEGKLLVGSAGNEGVDNFHISKDFTSSDNTLKTFFNFADRNELYGTADIWGTANKSFAVQVVVYNASNGTEKYTSDIINATTSNVKEITLNASSHGASGTVRIVSQKDSYNNKGHALVTVELSSLYNNYYIGLKITATESTVHAWSDNYYSQFTDNSISGWTNGNSEHSVGEIGGTGKRIITVGSFNTKNVAKIGDISYFSSVGPTIDGRTKPDITAPGSTVTAAFSSYAVASDSYYANNVEKRSAIDAKYYYYGNLQGTSMAAPHVTGIVAIWLQAKNTLTPEEVRTVLQRTSINDSYTNNILPTGNNTWGYGKINALAGLKECIDMNSENPDRPKFKIEKIIADNNISITFVEEDKNIRIYIFDLNGRKMIEKHLDTAEALRNYTIDLESLKKGAYVIQVKSDRKKYKSKKFIY